MRNLLTPITACLIISVMAVQLFLVTQIDGHTTDEQIHILSGYTTLTQAHALFDPEHPFLAKAVAALPLLVIRPMVPYDASHLKPYQVVTNYNTYVVANHWAFQMLYQMGNNFHLILWSTRLMMALVAIAFAYFCFRWTKSLWGPASAIAALVFVALDPNILAHGHLVNDDVAASFCFVAALAAYYWYLKRPSTKTVVIAGLTLGIGLITKYSLLLLGPIFVILLVLWLAWNKDALIEPPHVLRVPIKSTWLGYTFGLLIIFLLSWAVIWLAYGTLMILNPAQNPQYINYYAVPPWAAFIVVHTLPVMWAKGAALLFDPALDHFRDGYVLGQCYTGGRWYYFPVLLATKTPPPILLLFCSSIVLWWRGRRRIDFTPLLLLVALAVYLGFSMRSDINIGVRHVLPAYALILIIAAYPFSLIEWPTTWQQTANSWNSLRAKIHAQPSFILHPSSSGFNRSSMHILFPATLALLLLSVVAINLKTFPNFLSYYNVFAAEPRAIPFVASDSNVDWGQGTPQLASYIKQHHISSLAFDNFDGVAEAHQLKLPIVQADPKNHNYKGYLALSRSTIVDHLCTKNNNWGWVIDHYQPVAIVGNAINLYYLP